MTKATSDTTKLNFITDQGSTRATVRCACRAERFDAFFCVLRVAAGVAVGVSAGATLGAPTVAPGDLADLAAAGFFSLVPVRRKVRAGDDGEFGGGSGMSQANAAGETVVVSGLDGAALDGAALDGAALDGAALDATGLSGAGLAGTALDGAVGDGSATGSGSVAMLRPAALGASSFDRKLQLRDDPRLSAG
ncbi:MAG: hypothetical protein M3Z75_00860 [Actinomycetota bacterium]|nr:hypothetical protein [Actinomycetota bacterium]